MSIWIILSWVFVAILTGINVFIFLKLKGASEQMMKMAFPGAKNMNDALSQMQGMMSGMQNMQARSGRGPIPHGARPAGGRGAAGASSQDAQLKAAMDMLQNMQKPRR